MLILESFTPVGAHLWTLTVIDRPTILGQHRDIKREKRRARERAIDGGSKRSDRCCDRNRNPSLQRREERPARLELAFGF